MSSSSINRSLNGCLTCKNRKKKCDETRPICTRCINGDFECLGYEHLTLCKERSQREKRASARSNQITRTLNPSPGSTSLLTSPCSPVNGSQYARNFNQSSITTFIRLNNMTKVPQLNIFDPDYIVQMFLHYSQLCPTGVRPFTPFFFSINDVIGARAKSSSFMLKSTYIEAGIKKAISDGAGLSVSIRLIDEFQQQITNATLALDVDPTDVASRLGCLISLAIAAMQIITTPVGYAILRKAVPFFLALGAKSELSHFVFLDTVNVLVLGTIPLVHYDVTLRPMVQSPEPHHIEWAHGCSRTVVVLLARVNSWRFARLVHSTHPTPTREQQIESQFHLKEWNPRITYHDGDHPGAAMGRLAVEEIWRHSVLIYMHMGMCGADSADSQVEASVHQVAKLSATIEDNHPLEVHMTIPCIVAAAAARKEKHRSILRKKIAVSRDYMVCLVRGADFVLVLDHLWHGAAAGGWPTTWQDYVDSRIAVLPVRM
ncbi:unnamed protein product [Rhizoctonia solani]|uniref:Zn(2)-C6 fungal-type domain-containing protein n=1 Tax=Rhizoctonia solani TaxID=456999 RepID=A0A8H3GU47_9AGAM|nr:unnamed protein product [Rhizoctonia solani]